MLADLTARPLVLVGAAALALMLLYAGIQKIRQPKLAALALADFRLVKTPRIWQGHAAGAIEVAAAAALLAAPLRPWAWIPAAALLSMFAVLLALAVLRGDEFACFCFGDTSDAISVWSAARTSVLAASALLLLVAALSLEPTVAGGEDRALAIVAGGAITGACFLAARIPASFRLNRGWMRYGGVR